MIHNQEAEQAVIGSVLAEGSLIKDLVIESKHFADLKHRKIYQAMTLIQERDEPINIVSVTTELAEKIEDCGGVSYLTELAGSIASIHSVKHYQRMVLDAYRNRKTQEKAIKYSENPNDSDLDGLIKTLETLRGVGVEREEKTTYDYLSEIANDMLSPTEEKQNGFKTGYTDFDRMTGGGPQRGDLIIVAARPSMGKTAFALNMAAGHCRHEGSVDIFSLEMGTKQLLHRMISAEGNIDGQKWRTMSFSSRDYEKAMTAIGHIAKWDLDIHERARTVSDIRSTVRRSVTEKKKDNHMVVIDYLQLMSSVGRYERRDMEVGAMTRELKLLARELDIPIILLSQLSRGVEQRQDKRPMMSDLRESGNIEQDADVIGFLYRDDYYNADSEAKNIVEIILSKQRNGPVGSVELAFLKEYGKFVNLDHRYTDAEVPA